MWFVFLEGLDIVSIVCSEVSGVGVVDIIFVIRVIRFSLVTRFTFMFNCRGRVFWIVGLVFGGGSTE